MRLMKVLCYEKIASLCPIFLPQCNFTCRALTPATCIRPIDRGLYRLDYMFEDHKWYDRTRNTRRFFAVIGNGDPISESDGKRLDDFPENKCEAAFLKENNQGYQYLELPINRRLTVSKYRGKVRIAIQQVR